jgi:2'-5' RNA ligase
MQAIVALFSDESARMIYRIWDQISVNRSVTWNGVVPHISWHVARQYSLPDVKTIIDTETAEKSTFDITTTGLGIFRGETSYLYLPVTVNIGLLEQHRRIYEAAACLCNECNEYFKPDIWVPHITIQFPPLIKNDVCQSILDTWDLSLKMQLEVTSYGLIDSSVGESGILYRSSLKG